MTLSPPDVPPSEALSFRAHLRTRWSDEDNHGVLNNAVYSTLFEEGRLLYFSRLAALRDNRFPFLLAQTNVRFLRPGRGGEEVVVEMGTRHLGRTSFVQAYRVVDAQGVAWAEAEAACVFVDDSGRPTPIPEEVRRGIEALERAGR